MSAEVKDYCPGCSSEKGEKRTPGIQRIRFCADCLRKRTEQHPPACPHQNLLVNLGKKAAELESQIEQGKITVVNAVLNLTSILKDLSS